jgi:hypothetical protein
VTENAYVPTGLLAELPNPDFRADLNYKSQRVLCYPHYVSNLLAIPAAYKAVQVLRLFVANTYYPV